MPNACPCMAVIVSSFLIDEMKKYHSRIIPLCSVEPLLRGHPRGTCKWPLNPFTAKYDQRQIRQKAQISFCKIF